MYIYNPQGTPLAIFLNNESGLHLKWGPMIKLYAQSGNHPYFIFAGSQLIQQVVWNPFKYCSLPLFEKWQVISLEDYIII